MDGQEASREGQPDGVPEKMRALQYNMSVTQYQNITAYLLADTQAQRDSQS
jgi:hypothetical protein